MVCNIEKKIYGADFFGRRNEMERKEKDGYNERKSLKIKKERKKEKKVEIYLSVLSL